MTLTTRDSSATDASIVISTEQQGMEKQFFKLTFASSLQSTILATYLLCTVSELLAKNVMEKRKRGGRREAFGHGLDFYARRNGGSKMPISFKDGLRRPTDPVQAAKLSTECGIHI